MGNYNNYYIYDNAFIEFTKKYYINNYIFKIDLDDFNYDLIKLRLTHFLFNEIISFNYNKILFSLKYMIKEESKEILSQIDYLLIDIGNIKLIEIKNNNSINNINNNKRYNFKKCNLNKIL